MGITFRRVVPVASGDAVLATQYAQLAGAVNDRLISGIADGPERITHGVLSATAQFRTPADQYTWPSLAEYLESYAHVAPEDGQYPIEGPGSFGGGNLVCQINAYKWGSDQSGVYGEADRLSDPELGCPLYLEHMSREELGTVEGGWELGKWQRGLYDTATRAMNSPALRAAASHGDIAYGRPGLHGNTFGSLQPSQPGKIFTPTGTESCGDGTLTIPPNWNREVYFTAIPDSPDLTGLHGTYTPATKKLEYAGTCPAETGHVIAWWFDGETYTVLVNTGGDTVARDYLSATDWIAGPYTGGGVMQQQPNDMMSFFTANHTRHFRGSDAQRAELDDPVVNGFDVGYFLSHQYLLAPAYGTQIGDGLVGEYPRFRMTPLAGSIARGTVAHEVHSLANRILSHDGCVFSAFIVRAKGLVGGIAVQAELNGAPVQLLVAGATRGNVLVSGDESVVAVIEVARGGSLSFSAQSEVLCSPTGHVEIEVAELADYWPKERDLSMVVRLSTFQDGFPDGVGWTEDGSRQAFDNLMSRACVSNLHGYYAMTGDPVASNDNAVIESFRRFSQAVRILTREGFVGIAAETIDGAVRTRLRWQRYRYISGLRIDPFAGVAPQLEPVAEIRESIVYMAVGGSVLYNGVTYASGATFTGVRGVPALTDGTARPYDGILHVAPPTGWTNEWLLRVNAFPYKDVDSSVLRPDVFADYFATNNRCQIFSNKYADQTMFNVHRRGFEGLSGLYPSVGLSGYNYLNGLPTMGTTPEYKKFYLSCPIYKADYLIRSVLSVLGADNIEYVDIILEGRMQNTYGASASDFPDEHEAVADYLRAAPATFGMDVSGWTIADVQNERKYLYATDENLLRDYCIHLNSTSPCTRAGRGDHAWFTDGVPEIDPDTIHGTCYPRFFLTKLCPIPYIPTADDGDDRCTTVTHDEIVDIAFKVRFMCEGYIDAATTLALACGDSGAYFYDYDWRRLMYEVSGLPYFPMLPEDVLPSRPPGHGPMPATEICAGTFNLLAEAVNKLYRARIPFPVDAEVITGYYGGTDEFGEIWNVAYGARDIGIPAVDQAGAVFCAPAASQSYSPTGGGYNQAYTVTGLVDGDPNLMAGTTYAPANLRCNLQDSTHAYAVPEAWRDMVTGLVNSIGVACERSEENSWYLHSVATPVVLSCGSPPMDITFDPGYTADAYTGPVQCVILDGGYVEPPPGIPNVWHWGFINDDGSSCEAAFTASSSIVWIVPKAEIGAFVTIPLA